MQPLVRCKPAAEKRDLGGERAGVDLWPGNSKSFWFWALLPPRTENFTVWIIYVHWLEEDTISTDPTCTWFAHTIFLHRVLWWPLWLKALEAACHGHVQLCMGGYNPARVTSWINFSEGQPPKNFDCGDPTEFGGSGECDANKRLRSLMRWL